MSNKVLNILRSFFWFYNPKLVEAAGLCLILIAALWTYLLVDVATSGKAGLQSRLIDLRLREIAIMQVSTSAENIDHLRKEWVDIEKISQDIDSTIKIEDYRRTRLTFFILGSLMIIGSKIWDGVVALKIKSAKN